MGESGCPSPVSPQGVYDALCRYLDGETRWKNLADHFLGYRGAGTVFEKWPCPSKALLNLIFSRTSAEGAVITRENLQRMLRECRLPGAAKIVQEGMKGLFKRFACRIWSRYPKAPMQCLDDVPTQHYNCDQEDTIYEVPTVLKRETGPSTDAACASGVRQPEENDEVPDRINTLQWKDFSPHQAKEPTRPPGNKREPTQDNQPTGNARHESSQSPISKGGGDVAREQSNFVQSDQPYCPVAIGAEGNIVEFEQGDLDHYENMKVIPGRVRQPGAPDLPRGYVRKK